MGITDAIKQLLPTKNTLANEYQDLLLTNDYDCSWINYDKVASQSLIDQYVDKWNINTNCAMECIVCQISHIEKYKDQVEPGENPFKIPCNFIPKSYDPPPEVAEELTSEEIDLLRAWEDPVYWAEKYLGWIARPHQRVALQCSSTRVLQRMGRRSGKSESDVIKALHKTFTETHQKGVYPDGRPIVVGAQLMVVTPYLNQISEFFDKIESLLQRNEGLLAERTRFVRTPHYRMEFKNGAKIMGYTTGSSSSADAVTIRSAGATDIFFDETDYMQEGDFKAILPILMEKMEFSARASSTPKGSRESKYFKWAQESPDWKEFYFPGTVADDWERRKSSIHNEFSRAEIDQEFMAKFLAQDVGVYQPQYINHAYSSPQYEYATQGFNPAFIYSVGVDWNSNVGTEICVMALDETGQHLWVVECINIPKQGWTQLAGIEAILDVNKRWNPRFIYVDSGGSGGETSFELLRAYGAKMRGVAGHEKDARLFDIVKAYEFGSKIEIRDPATGGLIKKAAKDFMVQSSVRLFEEGRIHIPYDEKLLKRQLFNYIIDRVNVNNQKIYGMSNRKIGDHRLDAFNLSIVAFKLELSDFAISGPNLVTTVLYAGAPGERYMQKAANKNPSLVTIDARYPKGYMQYNVDSVARSKRRPADRTAGLGEGSDGAIIQPGKPVYPGSKMMEMKPGFTNDTEKHHKRIAKQRKRKRSSNRRPVIRRNI